MRYASRFFKRFILVFLSIIMLICISNSISFKMTEIEPLDPEFAKQLETPDIPTIAPLQSASLGKKTSESVGGGSEHQSKIAGNQAYLNYLQSEKFPLSVDKSTYSTKIDTDYKGATFSMYVSVTNVGEKNLYNVDIYEIIPEGIIILNCSHPAMTSSIEDRLRYYRNENLLFSIEDIRDPEGIAKKLRGNETLSCYLRSLNTGNVSNDLDKALYDKNKLLIKQIISKFFNKIIIEKDLTNNCICINESMLPARIYPLDELGYLMNLTKRNKMQSNDARLLNFLLLRDIYAIFIKKPDGNLRVLDGHSIDDNAGVIHIPVSVIHPKETLMFRYYCRTSEYGIYQTTTVARITGSKFPDYFYQKELQFPAPKFNIRVDPSKLEARPEFYLFQGDNISIKYLIDLIEPENESYEYKFGTNVDADKNMNIDSNDSEFEAVFNKKRYNYNKTINISFKEEGLYDIPSISINDYTYCISGVYIKAEHWHTKHILEISLIFSVLALFFRGQNISKSIKKLYRNFKLFIAQHRYKH